MINVSIDEIQACRGWIQYGYTNEVITSIFLEGGGSSITLDFNNFDLWLKSLKVFSVEHVQDMRPDSKNHGKEVELYEFLLEFEEHVPGKDLGPR